MSASRSATVWRVIRPCADRKTRYSTAAAAIAAVTVTTTTSRRAASIAATIGAASRQTPTTPTTVPSWISGRYSRRVESVPRSPGPASLWAAAASATAGWPPRAVRQSAESGAREARQRHVAREDGAVEAPDLGPDDPAGRDERPQPRLELGLVLGRDRRRGEVGGPQEVVDEAADDLGVGADGLVERRRRDVDRREHDLRRCRHADDHQEHAVHEEQQDRARRPADRARRTVAGPARRPRDCACRPGVGRHLAPSVRGAMPGPRTYWPMCPVGITQKSCRRAARTAAPRPRPRRKRRPCRPRGQAALNPPRSDRREPVS